MEIKTEIINGKSERVHNATGADEVNTTAICRICGHRTRRYVLDDGVVCVCCLKNY
jgi:hypothetical protein